MYTYRDEQYAIVHEDEKSHYRTDVIGSYLQTQIECR